VQAAASVAFPDTFVQIVLAPSRRATVSVFTNGRRTSGLWISFIVDLLSRRRCGTPAEARAHRRNPARRIPFGRLSPPS